MCASEDATVRVRGSEPLRVSRGTRASTPFPLLLAALCVCNTRLCPLAPPCCRCVPQVLQYLRVGAGDEGEEEEAQQVFRLRVS